MRAEALALVLLAAAVAAIPIDDPEQGQQGTDSALGTRFADVPHSTGDLVQLVELADKTTGSQPAAKAPHYTFAGTLQHVANRFCTEREKKYGNGAIFCNELIALQHKWIDAAQLGAIEKFTRMLGSMSGHFCPSKKATGDARCLVLSLLTRAVPANLRWNADRKRYLQMTKDVATHYCDKHGEAELFCPLMRALTPHYFKAVMTAKADKFTSYVNKMAKHYCENGPMTHPADDRCSIFPLLLKALPDMAKSADDNQVLDDRHALPNSGNVPPIDEAMMMKVDSEESKEIYAKAVRQRAQKDAAKHIDVSYNAAKFEPDQA